MENKNLPPLYSKTSSGKLQIWYVYTNGNAIHVHHGLLEGKKQEKITYAQGKNSGKKNQTSDSEQAILEAQSKWQYQKDRGYFVDKQAALEYIDIAPMRAQNFNDHAKKLIFPYYVQPKLNGQRLMLQAGGKAVSKSGLDLELPGRWKTGLRILEASGLLDEGLDGEVYAGLIKDGGLSLQEIISAFRKENENTPKLEYHVYDIPGGGTFEERAQKLGKLHEKLLRLEAEGVKLPIKIVWTGIVQDEEEATTVYDYLVEQGYEGMMGRNAKGLYEHGKRSYDLQKRKPRQTAEAKVLGCTVDKNNDGVLNCELEVGVTFECLMRKDSHPTINYRKYDNALTLIGKFIEFEFEEFSDAGVPTKPVGIGIREVNPETWQPLY